MHKYFDKSLRVKNIWDWYPTSYKVFFFNIYVSDFIREEKEFKKNCEIEYTKKYITILKKFIEAALSLTLRRSPPDISLAPPRDTRLEGRLAPRRGA